MSRPPGRPLPVLSPGEGRSGSAGSWCCRPRHRNPEPPLELVVQARREAERVTAAPGRRSSAAVVDERGMRRIVAVGLDAVAAGADVVVRIDVVDRLGGVDVEGQLLVELVPVRYRVHVRRVVAFPVRVEVVLAARVAHARAGMRPPCGYFVGTALELILDRRPLSVALPLVLELHIRSQGALHFLPQVGDREPELEVVLAADLGRPFVSYIGCNAVRGRAVECWYRVGY